MGGVRDCGPVKVDCSNEGLIPTFGISGNELKVDRSNAIARRRFISAREMQVQKERVNDMIRISPVRVIGPDSEAYGVLDTIEAKRLAREAGLDLVEISPHSRPPVCRIMDYGKYKYEQSKKERKQRAGSTKNELKEIRLGRSMRIDPHDIEMRVNQARAFLLEGNKVQFIQPFQGREMQHKESGFVRMKEIADALSDIAKVEFPARFNGRRLIMIVSPDRVKLKTIAQVELQKKREAENAAKKAKEEAEADDTAVSASASADSESAFESSSSEEEKGSPTDDAATADNAEVVTEESTT